jgi:redox-sensitive bicupin YhaK (pirin superfamily)
VSSLPSQSTLDQLPRLTLVTKPRTVSRLSTAPSGFEGEGFPVRRAFAGVPHELLDPFIHLDQMGEVLYAPLEPRGTPWHPHRGFETFTYLIDGEFVHQDSLGSTGRILPGGTQYMTAGDGVLHIETPPEHLVVSGGLVHGIQLWINLPRSKKRIAPQYQDLQSSDTVLLASHDGASMLRVLAGSIDGHASSGISHTPLAIAHATVASGSALAVAWPSEWNALVYVLAGTGALGADGVVVSTGQLAVLTGGDSLLLRGLNSTPNSEHLELLILGGLPLREPVVQFGPFVMSTRAEIQEAFEDYEAGRLGHIPPGAIQPHRVRR